MSLQMLMALFEDGAASPAYQLFANSVLEFASVEESNFNCNAQVQVKKTGEVKKRTEVRGSNTTATVDQYCTIIPTTDFGDAYHFKLTAVASSSWHDGGLALATWHALTADRTWHFDDQQVGPNNLTQLYDLDISDDGGSTTLDTIRITIRLQWDSP